MPRNMSFMLTTDQIRDRTKTVTRRVGWQCLKAGDLLNACVKCMGLKPGEKVQKLATIRVLSVSREPLTRMRYDAQYGHREAILEGFPHMSGRHFTDMFQSHSGLKLTDEVTRIEFEYVD